VAVYKGTFYSTSDMPIICDQVFQNNEYLFRCFDGITIDGSDCDMSSKIWKLCCARDYQANKQKKSTKETTQTNDSTKDQNPYAVGQLLNHSTENANVVPYSGLIIPDTFPENLWKYIPNVFFNPSNKVCNRVVVFVTSREVHNEELFFHYRFSKWKDKILPSWYK